jgi:hypothetical protein
MKGLRINGYNAPTVPAILLVLELVGWWNFEGGLMISWKFAILRVDSSA